MYLNSAKLPSERAPEEGNIWSTAGKLLRLQNHTPPLTRVPQNVSRPLSFAQERLWWLEQSEPGAPYYNVPFAWEIRGRLDICLLEKSLDFLVQRHEALRTTFPVSPGGPIQHVQDWHLKIETVDLAARPAVAGREQAVRLARDFSRRPFDLANGPLFRVTVFRWGPQDYLLVFVVHQMNFDGGSFRVINRELAECYRAFSTGAAPVLPPLPVRYSDFAHWQRQCLQGEFLNTALDFWNGQFRKRYEPLQLPLDHFPSNTGVIPGVLVPVSLPKALGEDLKRLCHAAGVTPFAGLLASVQGLLARYTGQEDILTLVSIAARNQPELRSMVGLVANILPMRMDLSGAPSFRQLLKISTSVVSSALAHQMLPLGRILEVLPSSGGNNTAPPLQVSLLYNTTALLPFNGGGANFRPLLDIDNGTAKFDLLLDFTDSAQGIAGHLKYRADIFEHATIERFVQHWQRFLELAVAEPDAPIQSLCLPLGAPRRVKMENSRLPSLAPALPSHANGKAPAQPVAPRNEMEQNLARIWESVFGIYPIGIHDHFFGLGGHSLLAVKLIAAIEKGTGRKLRLSTIFQEPTIARLAQFMQEQAADSSSSIIEIQPKGTKPPLFLVHGVGGGMFWGYSNLARQLGPSQPIYAFKSRAMEGLEEFSRIEDMAAHYAADLLRFQQQGPYYLGGYCFGGNVAYEMARQLTAQGHQVALVLLINCWPNNSSYTRLQWTPVLVAKVFWNFCLRLEHQIRWGARQPRSFLKWRLIWLRQNLKAFFSKNIEDKVAAEDIVDLADRPEHEKRLWRTHVQAWLRYEPKPYDGRIVLFRTRTHPLLCSFDPLMGWGSFASGGVTVKICPGDHESILEEENVARTARKLKAVLDEAQHPAAVPNGLPATAISDQSQCLLEIAAPEFKPTSCPIIGK